jgi:hypothetical protein
MPAQSAGVKGGRLFQFSKLEIDLVLESNSAPGGYWGSRLRGGYGRILKDGLCDHQEIPDCRDCPRFRECDYPRLFEPVRTRAESLIADAPLKHKINLPRAFVIDPPSAEPDAYRRGDVVTFGFVCIGPACESIAYPVLAFERFQQTGAPEYNPQVSRFRLAGVRDRLADGQPIFESGNLRPARARDIASYSIEAREWNDEELEIEFFTPVTVVNKEARERDPQSGIALFADFYDLVYNLANRVGGLWQLYGENWPGQPGFFRWREQLLKASRTITTTHRDLQMVRAWGYSNRQHAERPIGGFTGRMKFAGDFSPVKELLGIGEIVHVGNQTAFGLGRYVIKG